MCLLNIFCNRLNDIWTGLYSPTPNEKPNRWEGDCSPQPDGLSFWGDGELNSLQTDFCVRYKQDNQTLCTWNCNASCSIVCEFDKGKIDLSAVSLFKENKLSQKRSDPCQRSIHIHLSPFKLDQSTYFCLCLLVCMYFISASINVEIISYTIDNLFTDLTIPDHCLHPCSK